jgi:hypothetical protein
MELDMNTLGIKTLVWHSKYGNIVVAARDPEEEGRAWLYLFKCISQEGYYFNGEYMDGDEANAYKSAKAGDWQGAQWLLEIHSDHEYEQVTTEYVIEP